ncbi:phosphotransferase [Sanguibacter sp. 25GB23B1]|uniref:phosphotransferase n=1 Tax=unclassified Sanguibacter TaxID=2645534 RepID=UPI0032AFB69A
MTGSSWIGLARRAAARFDLSDEVTPLGGATGQVFACGGHVLRTGWSAVLDVELVAAQAAASVVPVPSLLDRVDDPATGRSVVLQRMVAGTTAYVDESSGTRRARRRGEACGQVHRALAQLAAPSGLPVAHEQIGAANLLHLDLHPLNILLDEDDEVTAVLDWTNTASGPPDLDRARTVTVLHLDPHARPLVGAPSWEAFVDGWTRSAGLGDVSPDALAWACRYMLDDLSARHDAAEFAHVAAVHARAVAGEVVLTG